MRELIENLRSFNSKERFFLVGHILGNTDFAPCRAFKESIEKSLGLKIPEESFAAMDYHLDWLYASLFLTFNNADESEIFANTNHIIKGTPEDVDYVMAFAQDGFCHIILIETKGVGGWKKEQMDSKAVRLERIFGMDGKKWSGVVPHFLLFSPRAPKHLNMREWPSWMTADGGVPWMRLPVPMGLKEVNRCDFQGWKSEKGQHWKVNSRSGFGARNSGKHGKSVNGKKRGEKNYREKLSLSEIITKCQGEGNSVLVGYCGGTSALRKADRQMLRKRRFKWDLAEDVIPPKVRGNWIPGGDFITIIRDEFPDLVR